MKGKSPQLARIRCKRTGGWCSAMRCLEVAPCPKTERPFDGRSCPRCSATKLEESKGATSHWIACTSCNWSVTTFFTGRRRASPKLKTRR